MQCSYTQTQWGFIISHPLFKTSAFESRYSVAPRHICANPNSDYTEVVHADNLNSDEANFTTSLLKSKLITSTSNPFVKHCLRLRSNSSYRRSHGSAVVVGATPLRYYDSCSYSLLEPIYCKNANFNGQELFCANVVGN